MREKTRERLTSLVGTKFGRLTIMEVLDGDRLKFLCQCECGETTSPATSQVLSGTTVSCGCLRKEKMRKAFFARKGNKKVSEMTIWDWK